MVRQEFLEIRPRSCPLPRTAGSDDEIGIGIEIAIGEPTENDELRAAGGILALKRKPGTLGLFAASGEAQSSVKVIVDAYSHDIAVEMHAGGRCDGSDAISG
jgi:hypothetical protein